MALPVRTRHLSRGPLTVAVSAPAPNAAHLPLTTAPCLVLRTVRSIKDCGFDIHKFHAIIVWAGGPCCDWMDSAAHTSKFVITSRCFARVALTAAPLRGKHTTWTKSTNYLLQVLWGCPCGAPQFAGTIFAALRSGLFVAVCRGHWFKHCC
jgi:hypothetical protein